MSNQPIRIAFIGAGDHARRAHIKHLAHIHGTEIVAIADPSRESFEKAQDEYGRPIAHWYKGEDSILSDRNIDAVLISSPDRFHLDQLQRSVIAKKHVFCEKPMADSSEGLRRLALIFDQAHRDHLVVTSCHPRRFDPPYVWLKSNLNQLKAKLGDPIELKLDFMYHKPSKTGLHGGSMLQDHMNHEFDYMNFLFGASGCTAHKLHDEEDRYHVAGNRDDGIAFSFGGTRRLDSKTYAESITLRFEKGLVFIDTYNPENSYIHDFEQPNDLKIPLKEAGKTDYDRRFLAINQNWVNSMRGMGTNYLSPTDMIGNTHMSVAFQDNITVRFHPAWVKDYTPCA